MRIEFGTEIIVKGKFKVNRDDPENLNPQEVEPEDETVFKMPTLEEKTQLGSWVHGCQAILKEGRIKHAEIEGDMDDDAKDKLFKAKLVEDPLLERLKPLDKDTYLDLPACWSVRVHGDLKAVHKHLFKQDATTSTAVVSLRSLVWPGLTHIFTEGQEFSLYIGDGHKYAPHHTYFPKFPYLIQSEPAEKPEQTEPTGTAPEDKKPDNN